MSFRAYVYNLEPFERQTKEDIYAGLEMVAAYIGETVVAKECRLKVKNVKNGRVNPEKIGLKNFDKMVEIHLLATPLDQKRAERLGIAGLGDGWGYVDTRPRNPVPGGLTTTTAHEVAHALGFVLPEASQADPHSLAHCKDPNCIMHHYAIESAYSVPPTSKLGKFATAIGLRLPEETYGYQQEFCLPCINDMRSFGQSQLNKLRSERLLLNKVPDVRSTRF